MNIIKKDLDQNNVVLTLNIKKDDYAENVEKKLRELRKKSNMPGFRPGMVPLQLVRKMYGKSVLAEEIDQLISQKLQDYIKENKIDILGEPLPREEDQQNIDFNLQEEFEFNFELGLAPQFEISFSKEDKIKYYHIEVTDEMIDNRIKAYASRFGKYQEEETVEEKDMLKGELVQLENGKVKENGIHITDTVITPAYMKDDGQKSLFIGAKKGDTITFNPAAAYQNNETELSSLLKISKEEINNIKEDFQFKIETITRFYPAEINQELFNKVYGENIVSSEEEFREKIKQEIEKELAAESNYKFQLDVRTMLIDQYKNLNYPDEFLKRWLLLKNKDLTPEKLEEEYPKIIEDVTWQLIREKLLKAFNINVEPGEVENYAKESAKSQFAQYGFTNVSEDILENYANDMINKEDTLKNLIENLFDQKIFSSIKEVVTLETNNVTLEEFDKLFETK
ncbi:MAG TPA: trigger factor [Paludibacteraceae bacterium]|nr:trigger factor [Paludibacteraceae bacterium]